MDGLRPARETGAEVLTGTIAEHYQAEIQGNIQSAHVYFEICVRISEVKDSPP